MKKNSGEIPEEPSITKQSLKNSKKTHRLEESQANQESASEGGRREPAHRKCISGQGRNQPSGEEKENGGGEVHIKRESRHGM